MKKYLSVLLLITLIIPSMAFASWWNPISWFKKNNKSVEQSSTQVQQNNASIKEKEVIKKKILENKIPLQKTAYIKKKALKEETAQNIPPVVITPPQIQPQNQPATPKQAEQAPVSHTEVPAQQTTTSQQNTATPPPTTPAPTLQIRGGGNIPLKGNGYKIYWDTTYASSCTASGDWNGEKSTNGEYPLSFTNEGNYIYNLTCIGNNKESISKSVNISVIDDTPKITFSFNGITSTTNAFTTTVGSTVRLSFSVRYLSGGKCTASGDWSGEKSGFDTSEHLTFDHAGTFNYILSCMSGASGERGTATATITITP